MHNKIRERRCELFSAKEEKMMKEEGYIIHAVIGETTHTHGLMESFEHPELECVLPTNPSTLIPLIADLADRVKSGAKLADGDLISDLIETYAVKIVASSHGLRLILPDPKGELERERMHPAYAAQYARLTPVTLKTPQRPKKRVYH